MSLILPKQKSHVVVKKFGYYKVYYIYNPNEAAYCGIVIYDGVIPYGSITIEKLLNDTYDINNRSMVLDIDRDGIVLNALASENNQSKLVDINTTLLILKWQYDYSYCIYLPIISSCSVKYCKINQGFLTNDFGVKNVFNNIIACRDEILSKYKILSKYSYIELLHNLDNDKLSTFLQRIKSGLDKEYIQILNNLTQCLSMLVPSILKMIRDYVIYPIQ